MANSGSYQDDPNISDDVRLFRRLPREWVIRDDNLNCFRPSSQAFNDSQDGSPMSVFREDVLISEHREPTSVLTGTYSGYGLAFLRAGVVRENGQGVAPDPLPDETAHALVFGPKPTKLRKRLAKAAELLILPVELRSLSE
jgi:hypothetical protein